MFGCEKITDAGLQHLTNAIAKMPYLRLISLNCGSCPKIKDKSTKKLAETIKSLPELTTVKMNFGGSGISNKAKESLKESCIVNQNIYNP
mmetsp:Transcript_2544/g.2164  ORF Transcript_2544/g.2164 Transcript_2544/m.2164 type:complete len:90 (-) Transcript_2544:106-375(-)